jgi:hypothetical protein
VAVAAEAGADLRGLHPRAARARARRGVLAGPDELLASRSGSARRRRARADLDQVLRAREGRSRPRRRAPARRRAGRARRRPAVGARTTRHWDRAAAEPRRVCSPGGSAATTSREAIGACALGGRRQLAARAEPGIKDHDRCARTSRRRVVTGPTARTAAATSRRR